MQKRDGKQPAKIQISTTLHGEDAAKYLRYKDREFLKRDSEAARKLILERLAQEEKAAA